jgi:prevent-host-death family protein
MPCDARCGKPGSGFLPLAMFVAMAILVNTAEFKDRLSEFLEIVEMGGEVIICRRNVPLAKVESMRKPAGGVQGARQKEEDHPDSHKS